MAALVAAALAVSWPQKALETLRFVLGSFVDVAPTIAVGLVISAWVVASGAGAVAARWFGGRPASAIVIASAIGSVTPVCGVTALPLMTGFLAAGVSLAPIMAFWLSSPVTDPAMFAVTWGILGPAFAIGKMAAAFALGVIAGMGTVALAGTSMVQRPLRASRIAAGGEGGPWSPDGFSVGIWQESERMHTFGAELLSMARLIALCLSFAFAAEFLLRDLLPPHLLASYVGENSIYAIPLAVLVGSPIYLNGYAALPWFAGCSISACRRAWRWRTWSPVARSVLGASWLSRRFSEAV